MYQLTNPYQYFLNIIAADRISVAEKSGVQLSIDIAKGRYDNLDISEVVISNEHYNTSPEDGSPAHWSMDLTCKGRSFMIEGLRYNTGTLYPMVGKNAVEAAGEIDQITTSGFYQVNGKLYLICDKDFAVSEALKATGFDITEKHYSVVEYPERNQEVKADAEISIDYSFLKGNIFLTYLKAAEVIQPIIEENKEPVDIAKLEEAQLEHKSTQDEEIPEAVVEVQVNGDIQEADEQEVVETTEETEKVEEQDPVEETIVDPVESVQETTVQTEVVTKPTFNKNKRR